MSHTPSPVRRAVAIPGPWQLINKIVVLLRTEIGLVDDDLAARLNSVRKAIAIGYNQGRLDRCWTGTESYMVLPAPASAEQAMSAG